MIIKIRSNHQIPEILAQQTANSFETNSELIRNLNFNPRLIGTGKFLVIRKNKMFRL